MKFSEIIQTRIRSLRKAKGWTQDDLAKAVEANRVTVAKWETGTMPSPDMMDRIAEAFGVPVWEICTPDGCSKRQCDIEDSFLAVMDYTRNKILEDMQRLGKEPRSDLIPLKKTV